METKSPTEIENKNILLSVKPLLYSVHVTLPTKPIAGTLQGCLLKEMIENYFPVEQSVRATFLVTVDVLKRQTLSGKCR